MIDNAIVGKFCSIAPGSLVGALNHPIDNISTHPMTYMNDDFDNKTTPVTIGNDVWIGANAVILSCITIPDGCVVAAGAVVTKCFEPFTVIGGVPARVIGRRNVGKDFVEAIAQVDNAQELANLARKFRTNNRVT